MHPGWRRCSSVAYHRYAPSSRLAIRAPRRSRCDTVSADQGTRRPPALAAGALVGAALLAAAPASAQIYTRENANGVVEATNVPGSSSDYRLTYPGKGTLIHSRGFQGSYAGEFDHHIEAAAALHQLNPNLVKSVIKAESEFDQWAVSSKGAQGLMQLMPFTARRFGVSDPFDARQNIFGGTQYLRILLDLFQGDVSLALAGYNAGENAVRRYGGIPPYRETRNYVRKVRRYLGSVSARAASSSDSAAFFVPSARLKRPRSAARRPTKPKRIEPARPRIYYRWRDQQGVTHVAEEPPTEGTVYATIRALD
jgi:soluble lytic murein transglycosylase-like protein